MSKEEENVNQIMLECLNLEAPKSFFLFAGAGSGKTRSLVEVLKKFKSKHAPKLRLAGQRVAVITYTNAACDEIQSRLDHEAIFAVSTIHSFAWSLIKPYTEDIRKVIHAKLEADLSELRTAQAKGRPDTKAAIERERKIESKTKRLANIKSVKKFSYDPNGENLERDSLNHSEVISLTADFLSNKPLMRNILVGSYPILLIDESQDTNKELINAFFDVQRQHSDKFSLGLFGDTMQRIYNDGEESLGRNIPQDWKQPAKTINYRCPERVIRLINKIREDVPDNGQQQSSPENSSEGFVRMFIVQNSDQIDKNALEAQVKLQMAEITGDSGWNDGTLPVKTLCLEHKMAARRGGFYNFFSSLEQIKSSYTGLLNGKMRGIPFFTEQIIPLVSAQQANDKFEVARILRKHSPLLASKALESDPDTMISKARNATDKLGKLWEEGEPTLLEIVNEVHRSNLLLLPVELDVIASISSKDEAAPDKDEDEKEDKSSEKVLAWETALQSKYNELVAYTNYISDSSDFGTHQGIKGRQFPRVLVVLDDEEAGGWLWSYEKLLGAKPPTATDFKNKQEGKPTAIDRTRRLFYVTCSRAEKSLAVVDYTHNPQQVRQTVTKNGWFENSEIIELDSV